MRRFSCILKSARITLLKNALAAKNILALLLAFSTLHYITRDLIEVCSAYSVGVQPLGLFVFSTTSYYSDFMFMFSFLLIMCDAPFLDDMQTGVVLRIGRTSWALGQAVYIAIVSVAFWLFVLLGCAINVLPWVDSSLSWGKIFISMASHVISLSGFGASSAIINNFTVLEAFGLSFGLNVLLFFFMGLATFNVNLATGKRYGVVVPFAMMMFHWQFIGGFGFPYVLLKISPVSLANLMLLDPMARGTFPTHLYALAFFGIGCLGLILLSVFFARRKGFYELNY